MVYAKTGRHPLSLTINYQIIQYWLKVLKNPDTSYFTMVYTELTKTPEKHQWIKHVKYLLC